MKKGIKLITILSLAAVLLLQGYWLVNMYRLQGNNYRQAVDQCLKAAVKRELAIRKQNYKGEMHVVFRRDTTGSTRYIPPQIQTEEKTRSFNYNKDDPDALTKIEQLMMHQEQPMNVVQVDSIFRQEMFDQGYTVTVSCVELIDLEKDSVLSCSRPGIPMRDMYASDTLHIDILDILGVKVYSNAPFMVILKQMRMQLVLSAVLMLFAAIGLFLQWRTIFRQWKEEKIRRKSVSAMVHELKRPVAALMMMLTNMSTTIKTDPARMEKYIGMARFEIDKLIQYIQKIQDISRKQRGVIELNKENVDLGLLFAELKERYECQADKKVSIEIPACNGMMLYTDKLHFANIMDNLTENAIKYSGDEVHIRIAVITDLHGLTITVHDNGWGIASKELPHIFDEFYRGQSKRKRDKDGFGLGLSYIKLMTEAMGGTIRAESQEDVYTEFILNFPTPGDQNLEP